MWTAFLLLAACTPQEAAPPPTPAEALAAAVDQPNFEQRRRAAIALSKRKDVSFAQWMELAKQFGEFAPMEPGFRTETVELQVLQEQETTEVHIHVPDGYSPDQAHPVLFALHGAGGSGRELARYWADTADLLGMLVIAPDDPEAHDGYRFTDRERGAAMAALRWARRHFNIEENAIHLYGESRGGHLAWDLATRAPDYWATATMAIGAPTFIVSEGRNNLRLVPNLRDLPIRQLQGMQDDPRLIRNLQVSFKKLAAVGATNAEMVEFEELGHSFRREGVDWEEYFALRRTAVPEQQVFRTASLAVPRHGLLRISRFQRGEVAEVFPIEVDPVSWESWDFGQRSDYIQKLADQATAQVELTRSPGQVEFAATGVQKLTLWVTAEMLGEDGRLQLLGAKKERKLKPKPNKRTLLLDFVERFDRRFLPVAEVSVDF